jgi:hypothetical protein
METFDSTFGHTPSPHPENEKKLTPGEQLKLNIIEIDDRMISLKIQKQEYEKILKLGGKLLEDINGVKDIQAQIHQLTMEINYWSLRKEQLAETLEKTNTSDKN